MNNELSQKDALKKILSKINSIINFGQTPYQIFKEKYYKRELSGINNVENKDKNEENEIDDTLKLKYLKMFIKFLKLKV